MLGNFTYCNPTKLYFGQNALEGLNAELPKYGKNVLLVYGGGSIKKNGIYDKIVKILKENGKTVYEDGGVMPNPTTKSSRHYAQQVKPSSKTAASCRTPPSRSFARALPWRRRPAPI